MAGDLDPLQRGRLSRFGLARVAIGAAQAPVGLDLEARHSQAVSQRDGLTVAAARLTLRVWLRPQQGGVPLAHQPDRGDEGRLQLAAALFALHGALEGRLALALKCQHQREQQVGLTMGARPQHRVALLGFGPTFQQPARFRQPAGAHQHARVEVRVAGTFLTQFAGQRAEALRVLQLAQVEPVFLQQFQQPDARLAILQSVGDAQRLLQQRLGLAGVDGVEVDACLAAQRLPEPVHFTALASDRLGLAIPAQRLLEATVQAGDVAQVDQQRRVALQRFRRQAVDPGCQRVELAGPHETAPQGGKQRGSFVVLPGREPVMQRCLAVIQTFVAVGSATMAGTRFFNAQLLRQEFVEEVVIACMAAAEIDGEQTVVQQVTQQRRAVIAAAQTVAYLRRQLAQHRGVAQEGPCRLRLLVDYLLGKKAKQAVGRKQRPVRVGWSPGSRGRLARPQPLPHQLHGDGPALGLGCDLLDFGAAELQIVVMCEKGGNLVLLEGEMPLVEGEHLPARLPASQTRNLQRIAGRQQEMDAVRRAVDEPIEDVQGLGVAVENVGVVQCQEQRLAVGDVQRVDQQIDRRRPWGRPLCPGLVPRVQPGQRCFRQVGQRLAQAVQQMQQEHQRIGAVAVELVPREGMAQPGH